VEIERILILNSMSMFNVSTYRDGGVYFGIIVLVSEVQLLLFPIPIQSIIYVSSLEQAKQGRIIGTKRNFKIEPFE